jgi:hypothetical protein
MVAEGEPRYNEAQVRRWLGWLAKEMASRNETELWLHEWSGPPLWRKGVKAALGVVVAASFALAYGLAFGYVQKLGLAYGVKAGLSVALGVGIAIALTFGLNIGPGPSSHEPHDRHMLALGLAAGLAVALVIALTGGSHNRPLTQQVALGDLSYGLAFGLIGTFTSALDGAPSRRRRRRFDRRMFLLGLAAGLTVALVTKLTTGQPVEFAVRVAYGLAYGLAFLVSIGPAPMHRKRLEHRMFLLGLAAGSVAGLAAWLDSDLPLSLAPELAAWLGFGLLVGLTFGLLGVGQERERAVPSSSRQPIRTSGQLGLAFGLLMAMVVALGLSGPLAFRLPFGLAIGLALGLTLGLDAVAFHRAFCLRLCMCRQGSWNWPSFLSWASERLLLRPNGASYQWIHLELRDYLARC